MQLSDSAILANLLTDWLLGKWPASGVYDSKVVVVCGCAILSA